MRLAHARARAALKNLSGLSARSISQLRIFAQNIWVTGRNLNALNLSTAYFSTSSTSFEAVVEIHSRRPTNR
jgi:hypothetical protein